MSKNFEFYLLKYPSNLTAILKLVFLLCNAKSKSNLFLHCLKITIFGQFEHTIFQIGKSKIQSIIKDLNHTAFSFWVGGGKLMSKIAFSIQQVLIRKVSRIAVQCLDKTVFPNFFATFAGNSLKKYK